MPDTALAPCVWNSSLVSRSSLTSSSQTTTERREHDRPERTAAAERLRHQGGGPFPTSRTRRSELLGRLHDGRAVTSSDGTTRPNLITTDSTAIADVDADVVIESSGTHRGIASAIAGATRGGTVVMVGLLPTGDQPVPISLAITRELRLLGSFRFNDEIDEVIAALADGSLAIGPIVTHTFPANEALEAFAIAADASVSGKVLLDFGAERR
ncbi:zinc-binding dehydrogenase [Saccharopolyspora erythraea]|uniref:zinc-binding dehydrogenase n=1 Tax=Saccharopolyspora erythraea TaxID=1836 RepID=UPI001BA5DC5C|nr:zinc-binding dehydrogenase [Saccharopolyspora erythraea]